MSDVYTSGKHYEKISDTLVEYLISDTIRKMLLCDSSLDIRKLEDDLFRLYLESVDKLIDYHKGVSHTFEEYLMKGLLSNETKGPTI